MSKKDNGGPAFPIPLNPGETYSGHAPADGMTLRDWFAGKALQGTLSGTLADGSHLGENSTQQYAEMAYKFADAMIAERAK